MSTTRQRWPVDAGKDVKWAKMDASCRGKYTGEAAWKTRHSNSDAASKLAKLSMIILTCWLAERLPVVSRCWWSPLQGLTFGWLVVVEICLLTLQGYYRAAHWKEMRGVSWKDVVFTPLPDFALNIVLKKLSGEKKPSEEPTGRASSVQPADQQPQQMEPPWRTMNLQMEGSGGLSGFGQQQNDMFGGGYRSTQSMYGNQLGPSSPMQFGGYGASPQYSTGGYGASPVHFQSPDICRSPAFISPHNQFHPFNDQLASPAADFNFKSAQPNGIGIGGSAFDQVKAAPPLHHLVETSYRSILQLIGKDAGALTVEASDLQRGITNHIMQLDKMVCILVIYFVISFHI